jgi:CheY-like chemotaxis protein
VAHDAMQALMGAVRSLPDAIVLDVHMPGGTGIEALRKLKASSKTFGIPVVVLSAAGSARHPIR